MNEKKMNLAEYYENLPPSTPPKTQFVERVAERCNLKSATIRLWVKGKTRPGDNEHLKVLSDETGIPIEDLF